MSNVLRSTDIWDMCEMSMSKLTDSEFLKLPFSPPKSILLDCQVERFSRNPKGPKEPEINGVVSL